MENSLMFSMSLLLLKVMSYRYKFLENMKVSQTDHFIYNQSSTVQIIIMFHARMIMLFLECGFIYLFSQIFLLID